MSRRERFSPYEKDPYHLFPLLSVTYLRELAFYRVYISERHLKY